MADDASAGILAPVHLGRASPGPRGSAAVFLDRDGVLNDVRGAGDESLPPRTLDEIAIAPEATEATLRLRRGGFLLIVVTNQPDVARGTLEREIAVDMTRYVMEMLALDDGYMCLHDARDGCDCRKPQAGMLLRAASDWGLELDQCWMIGDRWVDIAAAEQAGVRPILLENSYSCKRSGGAGPPSSLNPEFRGTTLTSCVSFVLAHK
jgi:D-glycero-D-manno-heptose 1,7-bisphosphate phosphatase